VKRLPWICATLTALLTLASCGKPEGADGYHFEEGTQMIEPRAIAVVTYPSYDALKAAYAQQKNGRKLGENEDLFAFAVIKPNVCVIHEIRPAIAYKPEEFGHELTHCLYGDFHPSQNDRG
jgi:hypothetical protein